MKSELSNQPDGDKFFDTASTASSLSEGETDAANKKLIIRNRGQQTSVSFMCKLCLEDFTSGTNIFTITSCGCAFCQQCMQSYVEVLVRDGVVISIMCPDAECTTAGVLTACEIEKLVQPETFAKYQRLKFEQEIAIDPHRTFCPEATCSTVCHVCSFQSHDSHDERLREPISVSCPTCHLKFCNICKAEWKDGHKCSNFALNLGSEFQKLHTRTGLSLGSAATIKRCPVCNILIERDKGCAQMICKNCSHVFCWYCLKLLDNDFMLRHYDKGSCKNMLGHSRAQVLRHRIGVVGLFAAFSLLLVIASPVLLLAAPCLLCWKCKQYCEQAINQTNRHQNSSEMKTFSKSQIVTIETEHSSEPSPSTSQVSKSNNAQSSISINSHQKPHVVPMELNESPGTTRNSRETPENNV